MSNLNDNVKAEIVDAATCKFGQVIEFDDRHNVLLIKRQYGLNVSPDSTYMTVEVGINENGIGFHYGHYDMKLMSATEDFMVRTGQLTRSNLPSVIIARLSRLIFEINANVQMSDDDMQSLCDSMDMTSSDILEMIEEGVAIFEELKKKL